MDWLAEWCLPLVDAAHGKMLAMKGPKVAEELPVRPTPSHLLAAASRSCIRSSLPGTEHRVIVEITKKSGKTAAALPAPRVAGEGEEPLSQMNTDRHR